jgi:eukaryotic-like serine/threonine-protein kinase
LEKQSPSPPEPIARRAPPLIRIACLAAAAAHVLYLALLISCDLLRVAPRGFVPRFEHGRVTASQLEPDSAAARAGIRDGDRLLSANGQLLVDHSDWQRMSVHLDPSRPLALVVERNGARFTATVTLTTGVQAWRGATQMPGVLAFRAAQVITLAFALLVAFKRAYQPSALLGALLLASLATVSLSLPMRLAVFWQALPGWVQPPLWLPFTTSAAGGALLFAFAAIFPRRIWAKRWIVVALAPAACVVAWHVHWGVQVMRPPGPATGLGNAAPVVFLVNFGYAALAVALLVLQRRSAGTVTDQRRIGVLILGTAIGAVAAVGVIAGYWRDPGAGVFQRKPMTLLALVFLAMPASFAYAILRHRLFDVRLIVRQGLRYALARRSVGALIPGLGALLLVDIVVHRQEPLASILEARWGWYLLVGGALLLVRLRREQWLKRVDRRFFRDRYDAHRLLTSIADQVGRAASFDAVAPAIVQQIEEALHPTFASVLRRLATGVSYSRGPGGASESGGPVALSTSLTVVAVLSALRKPLALSLGETAWVRHQLPLEERTLLLQHGIELLVPISGSAPGELPLGLLVLGARRSEEPYNEEDLELLTTIAQAVGALLERSGDDEERLAECAQCGRCYDSTAGVCAHDGHALSRTRGSHVINERYRLERRLGHGGMGVVYSATDTVLERPVAVKLIRDEVASPLDLPGRFRREARAAAGFAHPHLARVYDFGVERTGRPFLVMELLEGSTLRERLSSGVPLDPAEVLHILRGVCSALSAAHARDLVHRDLKPENIYLHQHAGAIVPKLLDFGLAKALHAETPGTSTALGTSAGLLIGTLEYMAPEQVAGDDASPGWDIWALSVIAYEMLTGAHPFRQRIVPGQAERSRDAAATTQCNRRTALRPSVHVLLSRALSRNRAERPHSADALLSAMEQALA